MKLSRLFRAGLGRTVIAALAAQVVAGAMCLMPASAMAAPQASNASAMPACVMHHGSSHMRHACPHCDAPVQAVSQIDVTHGLQAPAWVPVLVALLTPPAVEERAAARPAPRILAPPGSAFLIHNVTRRILI